MVVVGVFEEYDEIQFFKGWEICKLDLIVFIIMKCRCQVVVI